MVFTWILICVLYVYMNPCVHVHVCMSTCVGDESACGGWRITLGGGVFPQVPFTFPFSWARCFTGLEFAKWASLVTTEWRSTCLLLPPLGLQQLDTMSGFFPLGIGDWTQASCLPGKHFYWLTFTSISPEQCRPQWRTWGACILFRELPLFLQHLSPYSAPWGITPASHALITICAASPQGQKQERQELCTETHETMS